MMKYLILFLCFPFSILAQDSLLQADLLPHVRYFNIEKDHFSGEGADLLQKEVALHQYILLGEYHGSPHISQFTETLIPLLAKEGFGTFAIEVGPESARILDELSSNTDKTVERLKSFNQQYNVIESDGYVFSAIPFFDLVEDAEFLQEAAKQKWDLIGLDQEFCFGYLPLLDRMYARLNPEKQAELKLDFQQVRDSIGHYYKMDDQGIRDLSVAIKNSKEFDALIEKMVAANESNQDIAQLLNKTTEIYYYNASRQYLRCNSTRIDHMKDNLRDGWEKINFDIKKDKMLVKMGSIHTARGFSWLSLYEIGNTLSEFADFYGNSTLHIYFFSRYYTEDGKVKDGLAEKDSYWQKYSDLLQFAKQNQWTIIDLRPLKQRFFYNRKYKVEPQVKEVFKQHDWIIIPPVEVDGTGNY